MIWVHRKWYISTGCDRAHNITSDLILAPQPVIIRMLTFPFVLQKSINNENLAILQLPRTACNWLCYSKHTNDIIWATFVPVHSGRQYNTPDWDDKRCKQSITLKDQKFLFQPGSLIVKFDFQFWYNHFFRSSQYEITFERIAFFRTENS